MKRTFILAGAMIMLCIGCFAAGYAFGVHQREPAAATGPTRPWIEQDKPPLPRISINNVSIQVYRGTYSWCHDAGGGSGQCSSVDMAADPAEIMNNNGVIPQVVSPGAAIDTTAPEGIKEFTLTRAEGDPGEDAYMTPTQPGTYTYTIYCDWFADQGDAYFYFFVEVK